MDYLESLYQNIINLKYHNEYVTHISPRFEI